MQDSLNYSNSLVRDKQAKMRDFIKQTSQNYPEENSRNDLTFSENSGNIGTTAHKISPMSSYVPDWNNITFKKDFESVKIAKEYAINVMGIPENKIKIDGILNADALMPFLERMNKLQIETGVKLPSIIAMDVIDGDSCCVASCKPMEKNFYISSRFFNDKEKLEETLKLWVSDGYMPKQCRNILFIAEHEHAHLRTLALCETQEAKDIHSAYLKASVKQPKRFISYNDKDIYEFFADCAAISKFTSKYSTDVEKAVKFLKEKGAL